MASETLLSALFSAPEGNSSRELGLQGTNEYNECVIVCF